VKRGTARILRWFGLLEWGRRAELRLRMRQPRALPDAVILGAQKSGTSSLHNYLVQQPGMIEPLRKEVHYFDVNSGRGEAWYRAHFGRRGEPGLNIDSSPYYLFHPAVPRRMHVLLPDAKLIVLLRDPVRRAYFALLARARQGAREARIRSGDRGRGPAARRCSRAACGRHAGAQLRAPALQLRGARPLRRATRAWFDVYPRQQFLILKFEDLAKEPLATLNATLGFLGLPPAAAVDLEARNTRRYPPMAEAVAAQLRDCFEPHNRRLEALLGRSMGW